MAVYAAYHAHPLNRMTHFVGVPLIMFSLLIPLSWIGFPALGMGITCAMILVAAVLVYYLLLDATLGIAMAFVSGALLATAHWVAQSYAPVIGWAVSAFCFVGGWILQLVGHGFEGRRPALVDNVWQIFVAPIFLMAEIFFALGFKERVRERVRARLKARAGRGGHA